MSDYRHQPLTDQWVLVAGNREVRPNEYRSAADYVPQRPCPFCVGQEPDTPGALAFYPASSRLGDWLVRVVPNKFPALTPAATKPLNRSGPYTHFQGFGIHELVVLSPRHVESFSELEEGERGTSFVAFQDRIRLAWSWPEIRHAVVFENCRSDAGASIRHVHAQLIATSIIPPEIERRFRRQERQRAETGLTLLESAVDWELEARERVVFEQAGFAAFCPFASRLPYEMWLAPIDAREAPCFEQLSTSLLHRLADAVHRAVSALERLLPQVAYNVVLHLPPRIDPTAPTPPGHWFVELFPRLNKTAGFEWATGCMINQVPPELAAERLRLAANEPGLDLAQRGGEKDVATESTDRTERLRGMQ